MNDCPLRKRVAAKETLHVALANLDTPATDLGALYAQEKYDMVFADGQHNVYDDILLRDFCRTSTSHGVPVLFRIKHTAFAHLIGNYLDLGPAGVVVPQVEDESTIGEAIRSFYYPPVGSRGWGPAYAFGKESIADRRAYAEWWNRNGILALQLDSVRAVRSASRFAKDGVHLVLFGPSDLQFDLETNPDPELPNNEACYAYVRDALAQSTAKVSQRGMPFGRL
jgi:2-keto-3-deoxy-L-rhamnonate aldolase RhmA